MAEYRKLKTSDTWHWCKNCTKWPTKDYTSTHFKPSSGELCNECKAKDREETCRK
jgi:hypothetical protein